MATLRNQITTFANVKLNGNHLQSKEDTKTNKGTHGLSLFSIQSETEIEFRIVLNLNLGYSNHHQDQG